MADNEAHRVVLPDSLMAALRAVAADVEMPPTQRYEAFILIIHGYRFWDEATDMDPSHTVIPEAQWNELCGLMTRLPVKNQFDMDDIDRVNYGLSFALGKGPSSYKD